MTRRPGPGRGGHAGPGPPGVGRQRGGHRAARGLAGGAVSGPRRRSGPSRRPAPWLAGDRSPTPGEGAGPSTARGPRRGFGAAGAGGGGAWRSPWRRWWPWWWCGVVGWYEAEAHPFGGLGPRVLVRVADGESTDALVATLTRHGVIDSSLAFHLSLLVHGTPTVEPGEYEFFGNQPFSRRARHHGCGARRAHRHRGAGLHRARDGDPGGGRPRAAGGPVRGGHQPRAVRSPFEAAGSGDLEGLLGSGSYTVVPGETGSQLLSQMAPASPRQASAAGVSTASAGTFGLTPYQLVIVASITQKEGYLYTQYMRQDRPGDLQPTGQGDAAGDDIDRALPVRAGRRDGDHSRPPAGDTVQHLPQHRPHADPDRHALAGRSAAAASPAGRGIGSTSSRSARTAPRCSPTHTNSSWPTRSWPSSGGLG